MNKGMKDKLKELKRLFLRSECFRVEYDKNWCSMSAVGSLYDYSSEFTEKAKSYNEKTHTEEEEEKAGIEDRAVALLAKLLKNNENLGNEINEMNKQIENILDFFISNDGEKYCKRFDTFVDSYRRFEEGKADHFVDSINIIFHQNS